MEINEDGRMRKIYHILNFGIRVNNLKRWYKIILSVVFLSVLIIMPGSNLYSLDYNRLDTSLMDFLSTLSINYKGFDIKLKGISIGETYDDNILFTKKDTKEDFITNAGFEASVKYEGNNTSLEIIGNLYSETFAKNDSLSNVSEGVTLNFKTDFSEYERINLKNTFSHTYVPLWFEGVQFFEEQFGRTEGRFSYYKNRFNIDYSRDITEHVAINARYRNDVDIFSEDTLSDSLLNGFGLGTDYLLNPDTTLFFTYDYSNRRFEDEEDAEIHILAAGIRRQITTKLYLDTGAGLDFIDAFDDIDLIRPVVQASIAYEINEYTRARLAFTKKYDSSPFSKDIFNFWRTSALFTRKISERLATSVSLFYGSGEYISSDFEQRLLGFTPSFVYDINKNLKGNFTYTYSFSDSDIETAEYTKNTIFLGLTAEF